MNSQPHNLQPQRQNNKQKSTLKSVNNENTSPKKIQANQQQPDIGQEEINIYNDLLTNWKANQRTSLPRLSQQLYANPNVPQQKISIMDDRMSIFHKYTQEVVNYLKAKFIEEEIVQMIEQNKLLDITDKRVIQFMYLLTKRAWCDIHSALNTFDNMKSIVSSNNGSHLKVLNNPEEENLKLLVIPMFKLSQSIQKTFEFYHKAFMFRQKTFLSKFKSFMNLIFHNSEKTLRVKILLGIQGKTYTRQQQIKYTQQNLIPSIRKRLLEIIGMKALKMRQNLQAYCKIMRIQLHKLESYDSFQTIKNTIIKEEEIKYKVKPTFH